MTPTQAELPWNTSREEVWLSTTGGNQSHGSQPACQPSTLRAPGTHKKELKKLCQTDFLERYRLPDCRVFHNHRW
ncbi:hypothetical protein E2C01_074196 [Portunus trituberculatus]|uniref:Uncharacterized protein n=1 Tax=Portunus trituberculatus TaxID=210409 RepID=A0A5B7ICQ0_PORTR|nr:hypothetical protein [Portunus trituberculatus]